MTHDEQRLRRAMEDHEYLAPHPGAVYARVQLLAQMYRRRRFLVHSTGSVLLSAGLLVGLVQMHGFIQGEVAPPPIAPGAAESGPPPASEAPPAPVRSTASHPPDPWQVFREAGYDYDDAVRLARLWRLEDPGDAKTKAGRRILAGEDVPLRPGHG